jgi:hypothetical protein
MSDKRSLSVASLDADLLNIVCTHLLYKEQLKFISVNQSIREKSQFDIYDDIAFRNKYLSLNLRTTVWSSYTSAQLQLEDISNRLDIPSRSTTTSTSKQWT